MARRRGSPPPPRYNAMVASAAVMATRPEGLRALAASEDWMEDGWRFYNTVGELRFGVGWVANGLSRVNLVLARQPDQQGDEPTIVMVPDDTPDLAVEAAPEPLTQIELDAIGLVQAIAGGADSQGQLMGGCAIQLTVPGIGWILVEATPIPGLPLDPEDEPFDPEATVLVEESWEWSVLAYDELRIEGGRYQVQTGPSTWRTISDSHVLIKVWRPHPHHHWEADSPVRSALPILRQITMLDEHVTACAESRLVGAGLVIMPTEAEFVPLAPPAAAQQPGPPLPAGAMQPTMTAGTEDDFTQVLIDTASIAVKDRGSAAAQVPLGVRLPGELCDKPRFMSFWTEFSDVVLPLRNAAVSRLALALDMPPEVLTGMSDVNHWTAWQVEETAITLHIEPMAEIVTQALTIGYLQPALLALGYTQPEVDALMVWYDATDLTTRPDRSEDAIALYDRIEVSGACVRREAGLSEDDAPDPDERRLRILLKVAEGAPTLAPQMLAEAGIIEADVAQAAEDAAEGTDAPSAGGEAPAAGGSNGGPPDDTEAETSGAPVAASAAIMEACDGLVVRALERAGGRLRSAAGRGQNGGASAITCDDITLLHTQIDAALYATPSALLAGAWTRVPRVATRLGLDPNALVRTLDTYTKALIATGHAHDSDRLADALGIIHATG